MKRTLLSVTLLLGSFVFAFGQQEAISPADDPADLSKSPSKASDMGLPFGNGDNKMICPQPSASDTTVCEGDAATLYATGGTDFNWYDNATGGTLLGTGNPYTTSPLTDTSVFYVESVCQDSGMMGVGTHNSNYSGNVRGYWFGAPSSFTIVGLRVPTDASFGDQNIEILRFNTNAPPEYSSTTNDFTSLGYWTGVSGSGMIATNIQINEGDTIGIYGNRNDINSYRASGNFTTYIGSDSVVLTRSGMQNDLSTMQMQDVWSEDGGNISRVEMYYITEEDSSIRKMVTVNTQDCASSIEDQSANAASFQVFPNPTRDLMTIETVARNPQGTIEVIDMLGKVIDSKNVTDQITRMDLSNLEKGVYFVRFTNQDQNTIQRVIKE